MDYIQDLTFNFITIFEEKDPLYTQKICSMLDQEYDNYQIQLIIDKENKYKLKEIENYAKKENKGPLLNIITKESSTPIPVALKNEINKMNKDTIVVFLEGSLILTRVDILTKLSDIFSRSNHPLYVYTNYTNFPSLQKNAQPLTFMSSSFKAFYANVIQCQLIENFEKKNQVEDIFKTLSPLENKTHFIEESLYLLAL